MPTARRKPRFTTAPAGLASDLIQNKDGSSSNTLFSAGIKTKMYVTNADGSHDNTYYNITGQAYTTRAQHYDAAGKMTADTRWHADGTLEYRQIISGDGTKVTDLYDSTGHKLTEITHHPDGSTVTDSYNASTGALVQDVVKTAGGDVTTTNYSGGVIASIYVANADGFKESKLFDSAGNLASDYVQNTDGSSSNTLYSSGVKMKMYVSNADGSDDNYYYNITGQTYTTQIQHIDAAGKITSDTRLHADGSLDYKQVINSDGSKVTDLYDSAGSKTQRNHQQRRRNQGRLQICRRRQPGRDPARKLHRRRHSPADRPSRTATAPTPSRPSAPVIDTGRERKRPVFSRPGIDDNRLRPWQ